jgi:hypothetical protein
MPGEPFGGLPAWMLIDIPPDRGPLRIVVADDSVLLREGLVRLLAEDGHQVGVLVDEERGLRTRNLEQATHDRRPATQR